ncbi:MAG: ACP phosphodiesterase [Bacteroidia bacterium]
MNYLAHLYLSGNNYQIMIGNFIADHLKGKLRNTFDGDFLRGIKLHHTIDAFTDSHPVVEQTKARLRNHFHKYTPVIVDVFYDHFLAHNWKKYHDDELKDYVHNVYLTLDKNSAILPERTNYMLGYMKKENWLAGYAHFENLERIFYNMSIRTKFENNMQDAVVYLKRDYDLMQKEFEVFFEELKLECEKFLRV